jgi:transcriptional regulator ATRX
LSRFVNPIKVGQHKDSTEADVRVMKKRAHVLHMMLEGCVQRKDYDVIRSVLMPKREYVLSIRLSDEQIDLYKGYLGHRGIENIANLGKVQGAQLFMDFQNLSRVWTHPHVLVLHELQVIKQEEKVAINDFIDEDDGSNAETEEDEAEEAAVSKGFLYDDAADETNNDEDDITDLTGDIKPR